MFEVIRRKNDFRARKHNIERPLIGGLMEMIVQDKPNSKLQKYRSTGKGDAAINFLEQYYTVQDTTDER